MIRLALLAAATFAAWRVIPRIVEENRTPALLPAPSPENRPPVGLKGNQSSVH
jgi:hypothetical protein